MSITTNVPYYGQASEVHADTTLAASNNSARQREVVLGDSLVVNYARLHRRLWRHLGEACVPANVQSPEAYVYRVACNRAVDQLRSSPAWRYASDAELAHVDDGVPGQGLIAEGRSEPSRTRALGRALERLPAVNMRNVMAL